MITQHTVFILGAGASKPYGFPSGEELVRIICEKLERELNMANPTSHLAPFSAVMATKNISKDKIHNFIRTLSRSGRMSIDAFLEHRPEFMEIGKIAIATALIEYEDEGKLFENTPEHRGWYKYFFNRLNTSFDNFHENKFSIITFNYDRSIEHYLYTCLKNSYGKSDMETYEKLQGIKVVHLYGQLGEYLPSGNFNGNEQSRPYAKSRTEEEILIAANGIKIISEHVEDEPQFKLAYQLVNEADIVCFLGFGYNKTNLKRLRLENLFPQKERYFLGSTYGLTSAEIRQIAIGGKKSENWKPDSTVLLDESGEKDCLDSLRNNGILNKIYS